jgi:hypothetical protein
MRQLGNFTFISLCAMAVPLSAAPQLVITPGGVQANNWVWDVSLAPDLSLATSGTPIAFELGFRLTCSPLVGATNINPAVFSDPLAGTVIFGWETLSPPSGNRPVGLQMNTATGEIFAALGTQGDLLSPTPAPVLRILTQGPASGGASISSTIEWLGAYAGKGRIAQLAGFGAVAFDIYAGTATQAVPEPTNLGLIALYVYACVLSSTRRR